MSESTIEIVLNGVTIEPADLALVADCDEIAAVEIEAREYREALEAEPSTMSMTSLPELDAVATSMFFET